MLDQDADEARDHEGNRHRDQERVVEQARTAGADVFLHHEGDVGADHHHFAMRHVDDAHHAEGDGKPDRRQQQHRAEREPIPGVLHGGPDRKLVLHRGHAVARGALNRDRRTGRQTGQQVQRFLIAAGADHADGRQLVRLGGVVGIEDDGGARLGQRLLDPRIGFLLERGIERGQRAQLARFEHRLRRFEALGGIARLQAQAAERGIECAPHPVVEPHIGEVGRLSAFRRDAGHGIEQLARGVLVEHLLLLRAVGQPSVLQRLDDGDGPGIAGRRDLGDAGVGLAEIVLKEMSESTGKAGQRGRLRRWLGRCGRRRLIRRGLRGNGRCRHDQRDGQGKEDCDQTIWQGTHRGVFPAVYFGEAAVHPPPPVLSNISSSVHQYYAPPHLLVLTL